MNLLDILQQSQVVTDDVLGYLDAKSLVYFGSCSKYCRNTTNSELIWHNLTKSKGYKKFDYLINLTNHPLIPPHATVISPIYFQIDTETLEKLNDWREIYNRAEHLKSNWKHGIYFVLPPLRGHKFPISAFDTNGRIVVTGCNEERVIHVWSVEDCECINTIKLRHNYVNALKIYNNMILIGGDDGIIRIFDIYEGDLVFTLTSNKPESGLNKLKIYMDKVIAVFNDKSMRAWSLLSFEFLFIMNGHQDDIESLCAYENILATGSWDNSVIIWDLNNGNRLAKLEGHTEVINDLKIKKNKIVTASSDATLRIWRIQINAVPEKKRLIVELRDEPIILKGHLSDVYCVEINGDFICSAGTDSTIIVWNFKGKLLYKLNGHLGCIRSLYIDDYKLVSGGDAKKIMVWDYRNGVLLNEVFRNPNKLNSMIVTDTSIIAVSPEIRNNFFDVSIITYW